VAEEPDLAELLGQLLPPLIAVFDASTLSDLRINHGGFYLTLRRRASKPAAVITRADGDQEEEPAALEGHTIVAQMVGTFYLTSAPGKAPFVKEGDYIDKGQVIGIIEAMKVMNEVESEVTGRVVRILAQNQTPVEYGQPLMIVTPD
jgi:acetyl-CoA carboxylase biotin carboxyl carrier protein